MPPADNCGHLRLNSRFFLGKIGSIVRTLVRIRQRTKVRTIEPF
ncbi:MAG: hypothetical protein EAZ60_22945 [Oscillatoriales cyanobacterium]|nr:MAG: hypothetical protein EAZ83_24030 [Oscillatoriales cyanobacterium]TAE95600.1 MAG: hypothetical protein EAZ79_18250 [Oscillatoriales cyanobacterium]TAF16229.1 MAG: hypothetical protein EAZ73_25315 [Oscillatoriales cyanobacterium]TAF27229.1 MAG: hypothetical protein EAZ69_28165 [Oscillatoriales cyanobacterium]TAF52705.1 MAG: hypothetical protein EAZ60_22945 [Oscillatoriales cyanobacterium]